jgi:hypothetical protein
MILTRYITPKGSRPAGAPVRQTLTLPASAPVGRQRQARPGQVRPVARRVTASGLSLTTPLMAGLVVTVLGTIALMSPSAGTVICLIVCIGKSLEYLLRLFVRKWIIACIFILLATLFPCLAPILVLAQAAMAFSRLAFVGRNVIPILFGWYLYIWFTAVLAVGGHTPIAVAVLANLFPGCLLWVTLLLLARRGHSPTTAINVMTVAPTICAFLLVDLVFGSHDGAIDTDWDISHPHDHR